MKPSLANPQISSQQNQSESEGDPFFLCAAPIVPPLFTPGEAPLHRQIAEPLAKLEAFLSHPSVETMELAHEGAATVCSLMERIKPQSSQGGRASFRRDFAIATLEQIRSLPPSSENLDVFERMLTDGGNAPRRLSDSILAGITDLNEALSARLRRLYSREGGLCDRLAEGFEGAVTFTQALRNEYRRKTSGSFDGSEPAARVQRVLRPLVAKARDAMMLVPHDRALPSMFEERVSSTLARLGDYHFPDACRLMEALVGDMRELKHTLLSVEGLDRGLGSRVELSRSRRSLRASVSAQ